MEMEEHPPSWRKPGRLPIVRCEPPLSHLGAWLTYGTASGCTGFEKNCPKSNILSDPCMCD